MKALSHKLSKLLVFVPVLVALVVGCTQASPGATSTPDASGLPDDGNQGAYAGRKIVYVNSYHEGYAWSDGIEAVLHAVLDGTGVDLTIIRLDTKQHPEVDFGQAAGQQAYQQIQALAPEVVITSDDNAQKYLVVPYLKDAGIPLVFLGINWDASAYGYTNDITTGMIEVELPDQLIELLKPHANGERLGYLTIDTETERKVVDIYNQRFFEGQMQPYWVSTQDEFQAAFLAAQQELDILFMGNNAGSDKWEADVMEQFIAANTTIPTGSINDWMAPYSLLTLAKSAQEEGEWGGQAALQILDGTPVSAIPWVQNRRGQLMVNLTLADKLGIVFPPSLLKNAVILDE
jgi:hypothetical protein